jgi:hypothetical protein
MKPKNEPLLTEPTYKTAEGRAECKRIAELALLRGWLQLGERSRSRTPMRGKGSAWGWGK